MHLDKTNFKNQEKKLKKHYEEQKTIEKIILLIKESPNFEGLFNNPITKMYGFEKLRKDLSGYYSFNLCKNGGQIRLICEIDKNKDIVYLVFISLNHYEDFKKIKNKEKVCVE